mmetsp:Transcript_16734/g.27765  ORF Transcript_16734/g.27765 Transcript_16734/m.27765 type:complete len:567 (+) Transcript_16734:52-1752(+)
MKSSRITKRNVSVVGLVALAVVAILAPDSSMPSATRFLSAKETKAVQDVRRLAYVTPAGQCEVPVSFENFEGPDWYMGWDYPTLETGNQANFTKFLGRYGKGTQMPSKTYAIGPDADVVIIELDFYEVDSWDGNGESASVWIDDEEVNLGDFQWRTADDQKIGTSPKGVQWTSTKVTDPQHLGFHDKWLDQTHHISLMVPKSSSLLANAQVRMKLTVSVTEDISNESAGWDNILVSYETKCTEPPTPAPTPAPIVPTVVPTPAAVIKNAGVNGDPLIMGLKGQLFKFDGRSGAWYSAVSTPTFQWNMRISQFEGCPAKSDTFCSGAGFTFFDSKRRKTRTIEVNVVNEHNVDVGCGGEKKNCLGAGSLEIMLDGTKVVVGGDYKFKDGTGRVLAFNTFYQCARKWYDFEEVDVPEGKPKQTSLREGRRLETSNTPGVFDVMDDLLGETMIDKEVCSKWTDDRKSLGDLFDQGGHYSTVIIQTEEITLHVEYKQENERCNAHSVNVWMSSVNEKTWNQPWEGVIGETKDAFIEKKDIYSRTEMLKFADDEAYEVKSPFATTCKGCVN